MCHTFLASFKHKDNTLELYSQQLKTNFGRLNNYISRLNEILRHDLTLSVGEPDNAAAKQGQELRSV